MPLFDEMEQMSWMDKPNKGQTNLQATLAPSPALATAPAPSHVEVYLV